MNEQTILWHTASGCGDDESLTGVPASSVVQPPPPKATLTCFQCVRAQISQMLSLGTAGGLAPSHCVHPAICFPFLCFPEAGGIGLEGWSLEQVPGAAWPGHGSQVELLNSIPRCLRSWQKLLMLFPYNQPSVALHCLQDESKLRPQKHLLTDRFGLGGHTCSKSQWWREQQPSDPGGVRPYRLHLAISTGSLSSLRKTLPTVSHGSHFLLSTYPSKPGSKASS